MREINPHNSLGIQEKHLEIGLLTTNPTDNRASRSPMTCEICRFLLQCPQGPQPDLLM